MTISDSLQQIYFLGVHPEQQSLVAEHLLRANEEAKPEHGRWHLFARLARPGLVAMRSVARTSGLDLFLLDEEMQGVEDVAEIIGFGLEDDAGETAPLQPGAPHHATAFPAAWRDFENHCAGKTPACLFLTFLRLNWQALMEKDLWKKECRIDPPSRTKTLRAIAATLRRAVGASSPGTPLQHLHISGGVGDCDLIITGLVNSRVALDNFLLILAQVGTDCVAAELGAPLPLLKQAQWYPICASSTTELAVPWDIYAEVQSVTRQAVEDQARAEAEAAAEDASGGEGACPEADTNSNTNTDTNDAAAGTDDEKGLGMPLTEAEEKLREIIDPLLVEGLRSAVFLRRTRSFLTPVRQAVRAISPPEWTLQSVLGDADMLLRRADSAPPPSSPPLDALSNLLLLLGRLDAKTALDPDFPRRIAVVITFDRSYAEQTPDRGSLLQNISDKRASSCPVPPPMNEGDRTALKACQQYLRTMLTSRRREEYRILERMVERSVTLQRQHDVSREVRTLARLTLRRLERALSSLVEDANPRAGTASADDESLDQYADTNEDFIGSGMHLDRTLLHHARGSIPLLLATAMQARSADHFGSETLLTSALGAPASSVAGRLLDELKARLDEDALLREAPAWADLKEALADTKVPILYASHDPDFELIVPLGMIRVPRWVIWYPTVASYVLHEVGHEVFICGKLRTQADRVAWTAIELLITREEDPAEDAGTEGPAASAAKADLNSADEADAEEEDGDTDTNTDAENEAYFEHIKQSLLNGGQAPATTLPAAGPPPAAVLWIEELLLERMHAADKSRSNIAMQDWHDQISEVTAQLFCHRYSYWPEESSQVGSDRHVYDMLEHIAPLSHRLPHAHRHTFITRELAVRIALQLIEAGENGRSPWLMSEAELSGCVVPQIEVFRKCLARWLNQLPVPFQDGLQNTRLLQDVLGIYSELQDFPTRSSSEEFHARYHTSVGKAVARGVFVALLATSRGILPGEPASVQITQHLWQAILKTSRAADTAPLEKQEQEQAIVASLVKGKVPDTISQWPERLPRRLHDALRQENRSVNLPQRFALTLALADWMVVNDASEQALMTDDKDKDKDVDKLFPPSPGAARADASSE